MKLKRFGNGKSRFYRLKGIKGLKMSTFEVRKTLLCCIEQFLIRTLKNRKFELYIKKIISKIQTFEKLNFEN